MPKFDVPTKLKELKRELGQRKYVYPRRIADGKMSEADAALKISLIEAIIEDYEQLAKSEQPGLF